MKMELGGERGKARTIVITGGGGGIGRALALLCGRRGDYVVVLDKDASTSKQTAEDVLAAGAGGALGLACDVSDETQVEAAFAEAQRQFGVPYGIFANAGIDVAGYIHELPMEKWRRIVDTNLTGVFLTCKHGLKQMLATGVTGSIVCTSSPCGFMALAGAGGAGSYSATKGGISALVRCMAIDYARFGIRVNAIVPGATETGMMWNNVPPDDILRMRKQLDSEIPLGRVAQAEEPAKAALWLLSEESSYVTGSHLVCDGGILAKSSISV